MNICYLRLTKACRLKNDKLMTRIPIQKKMLSKILNQVTKKYLTEDNQPYLATLYQTIFSTMYHGLLRIGEAVTGTHPVLAKDVQIGTNKKKFLLILRHSKTPAESMPPQLIKISAKKTKNSNGINLIHKCLPCPFKLLREYSKMRPTFSSDSEPFFVFSDGSPVTVNNVTSVLKSMIKAAGYDEKNFSGHCLRSGRTCDLYKLGLPIETIKKIGRWRSNAIYCYLRC